MADYYSVLKKTVAALPENTGAARRNIYQRARTAIVGQLKAYDPPLSPSEITNEQLRLEEAIRKVEAEAARETLGLNRPPEEPAAPGFARKPEEKGAAAAVETPGPGRDSAGDAPPLETPPVGEPPSAKRPADAGGGAENGRKEPAFEGGVADTAPRAEPGFEETPPVAPSSESAVKAEKKGGRDKRSGRRAKEKKPAAARPPAHDRPSRIPVVVSIIVALLVLVGIGAIGYSQRDALLALLEDTGKEASSIADVTPASTDDKSGENAGSPASNGKIDARLPTAGGNGESAAAPDARTVTTTRISPATSNGGTSAARQEDVRSVEPRQVGPGIASAPSGQTASPAPSAADDGADAAAPQVNAPAADTSAGPATQSQSAGNGSDAASDDSVRKVETASISPDTGSNADSGGNAPAGAAVAQRSILYEEGPDSNGSGSASPGQAVWSIEGGSNGEDAVLRIDANITDRNISAEVTIKPNTDDSLPASHLVEVQFEFPQELAGNGVANVPGLVMKRTEEARGDALIGASVKVADNLFWVALSNVPSERDRNMSLLRERGWIDIPILYEDGKRAILTLEKGTPGTRAVEQALASWQ
ncbi:hypothetical protein GR183_10910 [Stappia sp. GBMRC 2046]|uniref:CheA signal transduction histidine kinase n=1 Tax=Stappia sediminis TaxID=2692190 RepID=A0A7X3LUN1_9HYPH|nr:hypothetical protein [Stappia sediminis]MXN65411.1 hypothetical protein [Stappia sediminis]